MDRLVENDTKPFHWQLSKSESRGILEELFPDSALFGPSNAKLKIPYILDHLRDKTLYGVTKGGKEHWAGYPKTKLSNVEAHTATFLNHVLDAVEEITGDKMNRSVVYSVHRYMADI